MLILTKVHMLLREFGERFVLKNCVAITLITCVFWFRHFTRWQLLSSILKTQVICVAPRSQSLINILRLHFLWATVIEIWYRAIECQWNLAMYRFPFNNHSLSLTYVNRHIWKTVQRSRKLMRNSWREEICFVLITSSLSKSFSYGGGGCLN